MIRLRSLAVGTAAAGLLTGLLLPLGTPARAATSWQPDPATYGVYTQNDVPITMSDGVVLRANIAVPLKAGETAPRLDGSDRWPVLLTQTPYRKDGGLFGVDTYFVQRGYAYVITDVRGTGSSEGQWTSFGPREQKDGPEVIDWIIHQPWAQPRLGLLGASYLAINQLLTMEQDDLADHPLQAVKALFPVVPMSDSYRDVTYHGGNLDQAFIPPWLGLVTALGLPPANQATDGNPNDAADAATVAGDHVQGATNFQAQVAPQAITGGPLSYDGDFYRVNSPIERIDRIHIPTFIVGGEFDIFQRGEPLLYNALDVPAKRLLIGPWIHLEGSTAASLPADGIPDLHTLQLQWFDQYVRGQDTGEGSQPRVLEYELKGQDASHFVASPTWPLQGMHPVNLYLDGTTSGSAQSINDGSLKAVAPSAAGQDPLVYNPVGTGCTRTTFQWGDASTTQGSGGGTNQVPCENDERPNEVQSLTYTTPVLSSPVTVNGPLNVHLVAESVDGQNITFTVHLTDVAPSGASVGLTAGWLLASQRAEAQNPVTWVDDGHLLRVFHPFTQASEQAVPSGPTAYDIEVFPTYATFQAGHRLRLDITTGDEPHMAPSLPHQAQSAAAIYMVDRGGANPSYVTLPVVSGDTALGVPATPSSGGRHNGVEAATLASLPFTSASGTGPASALAAALTIPVAAAGLRRRRAGKHRGDRR